ncbi:MAG: hypothetical protein ACR2PF_19785 [Rhizobiaceae bacterium]
MFFRLNFVDQVILAMLNGRRRDEFALKVCVFLKSRAKRWENLSEMQPSAVTKLIDGDTYADKKTRELPEYIREIIALRGHLDLDIMRGWTLDYAHRWIETITGIGPKISCAALNVSTLNMRILMVDTAHRRVAERYGLIPQNIGDKFASRLLNWQVPDYWTTEDTEIHHFLIQMLGKEICASGHSDCSNYPLVASCPTNQAAGIETFYLSAMPLRMAS